MILLQRGLWTVLCISVIAFTSCTQTSPLALLVKNRPDSLGKRVKSTQPAAVTITELPTLPIKWEFELPQIAANPQPIPFRTPLQLWLPDPYETLRDSIVLYAKQYLGRPYRRAGQGPRGFDCSGFTSYIMSRFGYSLPRSSASQAVFGTPIAIEEARKGDLIFFGNKDRRGKFRVNHAALVISEAGEELVMIHAANRGITIDNVNNVNWESYYGRRLIGARRVIHDGVMPPIEQLLELIADNQIVTDNLLSTRHTMENFTD
ncbi:C40 family peptidase [Rhodoflexus sp.]